MTVAARINHAFALRDARHILASKLSPVSPAVRLARAYVDLHDKTTATLRRSLEKLDGALAAVPEEGGADA